MRRWLILLLPSVALAAACGSDSSGPNDGPPSLAGVWSLEADVSNGSLQVSCVLTGMVTITQSGNQFSGQASNTSGLCTAPGQSEPFTGDGPLTGGTISGSQVSYTDGVCTYTGTMSGDPVNRIQGDVSCDFPIQGTDVPMNGTWQLSR